MAAYPGEVLTQLGSDDDSSLLIPDERASTRLLARPSPGPEVLTAAGRRGPWSALA